MDTLDFHVEIGAGSADERDPGRPRSYEITLRGSAGDEASEVKPFPLTPVELRALDTTVPHAVLSSAAHLRRAPTSDELPVRELGRKLHEFLLGGRGRPLLAAARDRAAQDDRPLRIVLRVRPAELARLPWEFLYDPDEHGYVCQTTSLVRRPEVSVPERPLTVRPPLRVLCMAARPDDRAPLAVRAEREWLGRALSELRRQELIHVEWTAGPTWRDLRTALHGGTWHAFHFIGHGGFDPDGAEGTLALADDDGGTYHLGAEDLAMLLARRTSLRLVVLNACETGRSADRDPFSSVAGALMRKGVPAVVAMQYPISNDAAVEFSRTFYESLAQRRPVDEAVTEARQTIRLARRGTLEWVTPVLFMRSLDGRLFDLADAGTPVAAADEVSDLYMRGLAALRSKRWQRAVDLFRDVMVRDPGHSDARAMCAEALRLRSLHDLYEAGLGAIEERRWDAAVDHLEAVDATDPSFLDTHTHLTEARRRRAAEAWHTEAAAFHAAGEWEAVLAVATELAALVPENPDPNGLAADARARLQAAREAQQAPGEPPAPPSEKPTSTDEPAPGEVRLPVAELTPGGAVPSLVGAVEQGEVPPPVDDSAPDTARRSTEPPVSRQGSISDWAPPVIRDSPAPATRHAAGPSAARSAHDVPVRVQGRPLGFSFSPDGTRFVVACLGRKALIADVLDPGRSHLVRHDSVLERLGKLAREDRMPIAAALAPGGQRLVTYAVPTLRVWDVDRGSQLAEWRTDEPEGQVALGTEGLNALFLPGGSGAYHWRDSQDAPDRLTAQEDKATLAVTSRDGTMFATVDAPEDVTRAWILAAQGVRTRTRERHVRVWDARTGRLLAERNCGTDVIRVALHPRNTAFVTGHGDGRVRVWGPEGSGSVVAEQGSGFFMDIAYDREGHRLAVAKEDGASVQDLRSGRMVASRRYGFDWKVRALAFGPDGVARALVEREHEVWLTTIATMAQGIRGIGDDDGPTHARLRGDVP